MMVVMAREEIGPPMQSRQATHVGSMSTTLNPSLPVCLVADGLHLRPRLRELRQNLFALAHHCNVHRELPERSLGRRRCVRSNGNKHAPDIGYFSHYLLWCAKFRRRTPPE
jgi:hypothetical protein